ncbi:UDP-glucose 4-epimerase GalE [Planococcus sp. ANT_H30]|uniref:UDP-glucose 4-epimerase GalE n=1 Tax=Planococcus sp. ANT_H30 TaxID=2597347 RepID=UPI0011EC97D8|nr:UDP-glucose 4-epimerase GalE [Planococcus sp. ANT_H30]KAA0958686.1 UDP-glucose 4-epimerase GalE [Planococcus sp. ANT_H30]
MAILVCGGAGYIGSHTVKELVTTYEVVVLDNLTTGFESLVDKRATFVKGDLGDPEVVDTIFKTYSIDAVFHFAANSLVGESVENPLKYYRNNVGATLVLLEKMIEYNVNRFIFSSTAATYGIPNSELITEETATNPINPYGRSKLMIEQILADMARVHDFQYVVLRYFNAAGAHHSGEIGESHDPESHLIPIVLQHLLGEREQISVFGTDYETSDGTCVRDYIHVTDLARAHILSYEGMTGGEIANQTYNLGNGAGYSVNEIIETCQQISGKQATINYAPRRAGDPAALVASSDKISKELGWQPTFDLTAIISSAWAWHSK